MVDKKQDMQEQIVKFRNLSVPLKVLICYCWFLFSISSIYFVVGLLEVMFT